MGEKHGDFDLEIVLKGFQDCLQTDGAVHLLPYLEAFEELCRFFKLMGRAFQFVARYLDSKIQALHSHLASEMGEHYETVESMIRYETECGIAMVNIKGRLLPGSKSLLRLQQALEFIIQFMDKLSQSPVDANTSQIAGEVYGKTLAKHHMWIVRQMAFFLMRTIPSRQHLIEVMCKHDQNDVIPLIDDTVRHGQPVYEAIEALYIKYNLL